MIYIRRTGGRAFRWNGAGRIHGFYNMDAVSPAGGAAVEILKAGLG